MKKICLLLVGLLVLFSCEQEELDNFVKSDMKQTLTRATSSIADFDPIVELAEVPLNIINVGNNRIKFLSCPKSGNSVHLTTVDDGSLRQRWYVQGGNIFLVGGNSSISLPLGSRIGIGVSIPDYSYPFLTAFLSSTPGMHNFTLFGNSFFIRNVGPLGTSGKFGRYLQANSKTDPNLSYRDTNPGDLALWYIHPVGIYELVDLQYVMTPEDKFVPTKLVYDRDEYVNSSNSVQTWHYSVKTSVTESSNYSEVQGFSISFTQGITVGLPNLSGDGGTVTVNNTVQQQSSKTWNFGNNKSITSEKTRTGDIPVQPGETIFLDAELTIYKGSLTYVATLRKVGETKTFRVKGKWEGECYSKFKAKTYSSSGEFLKEYDLQ